jgi:hypothetical protein
MPSNVHERNPQVPVAAPLPTTARLGLTYFSAPEDASYVPRPPSRELNMELLEAVLQRLLNDHRLAEAVALIAELQLYALTLTASLTATLELVPCLLYLAGVPFDSAKFPAPGATEVGGEVANSNGLASVNPTHVFYIATSSATGTDSAGTLPPSSQPLTASVPAPSKAPVESAIESLFFPSRAAEGAKSGAPLASARSGTSNTSALTAEVLAQHDAENPPSTQFARKAADEVMQLGAGLARANMPGPVLDARPAWTLWGAASQREWVGAFLACLQSRACLRHLNMQTPEEEDVSRAKALASSKTWVGSVTTSLNLFSGDSALIGPASSQPFLNRIARQFLEVSTAGKILSGHAPIRVVAPAAAPVDAANMGVVTLGSVDGSLLFSLF